MYFIKNCSSSHLGQTMPNPGQEPYLSPSPNPQSSGRNTIPCSELNNKTTFLPLRFASDTFKSFDGVFVCIFFSIIKCTSVMRKFVFLFSFAALFSSIPFACFWVPGRATVACTGAFQILVTHIFWMNKSAFSSVITVSPIVILTPIYLERTRPSDRRKNLQT